MAPCLGRQFPQAAAPCLCARVGKARTGSSLVAARAHIQPRKQPLPSYRWHNLSPRSDDLAEALAGVKSAGRLVLPTPPTRPPCHLEASPPCSGLMPRGPPYALCTIITASISPR